MSKPELMVGAACLHPPGPKEPKLPNAPAFKRMEKNCRQVMMVEEVNAPKAAIVLSRTIRPIADVAESKMMSPTKAGDRSMRLMLGPMVVKEAKEPRKAIPAAKALT